MRSYSVSPQRRFFLVFDKGDDVLATLRAFAESHAIRGASFVALGAFSSATIAYWNPATKEYEKIAVDEQVEVLSLAGNVGVDDKETKIHAHTTHVPLDLVALGVIVLGLVGWRVSRRA